MFNEIRHFHYITNVIESMNWYWWMFITRFSVNLDEFWLKIISNSQVKCWNCISRQSVQYRQQHYSLVQYMYATGYIGRFLWKSTKNYSLFDIKVNLIYPYLLSMQIILTSTFQLPPLFSCTTVRSILHAKFGTYRGAIYYVM